MNLSAEERLAFARLLIDALKFDPVVQETLDEKLDDVVDRLVHSDDLAVDVAGEILAKFRPDQTRRAKVAQLIELVEGIVARRETTIQAVEAELLADTEFLARLVDAMAANKGFMDALAYRVCGKLATRLAHLLGAS